MNCRICRKPLKEHTSVKLRAGPVCRAREALNGELDLFPHARYEVRMINKSSIYLVDTGTDHKSVTDDIAWVLARLDETYGIRGRRIFYRDSQGRTDEITHDRKGRFTGFRPGTEVVL